MKNELGKSLRLTPHPRRHLSPACLLSTSPPCISLEQEFLQRKHQQQDIIIQYSEIDMTKAGMNENVKEFCEEGEKDNKQAFVLSLHIA